MYLLGALCAPWAVGCGDVCTCTEETGGPAGRERLYLEGEELFLGRAPGAQSLPQSWEGRGKEFVPISGLGRLRPGRERGVAQESGLGAWREPKGGSHKPGERLPWVQESTEAKPSSSAIRQVKV